jgi:large subunit ribosomal protein L6
MSRIGKLPVPIPPKVKVAKKGEVLSVEGPRGKLSRALPSGVEVILDQDHVRVERRGDDRRSRSLHGLVRTLINNMVVGVTDGFSRKLEIVGVGYRAERQGDYLWFNLGYSHPILYELPVGVDATVEGTTKLTLTSNDKEALGKAAATIRSLRPPEPYKGKGIRYAGEVVRSKVGKAGVAR